MALLVLLNLQLECLSSHSWDDIPASEVMAYIPELAIGTYGIGIQPFARSLSLDVIKTSCQSETARKGAGRQVSRPAGQSQTSQVDDCLASHSHPDPGL